MPIIPATPQPDNPNEHARHPEHSIGTRRLQRCSGTCTPAATIELKARHALHISQAQPIAGYEPGVAVELSGK